MYQVPALAPPASAFQAPMVARSPADADEKPLGLKRPFLSSFPIRQGNGPQYFAAFQLSDFRIGEHLDIGSGVDAVNQVSGQCVFETVPADDHRYKLSEARKMQRCLPR